MAFIKAVRKSAAEMETKLQKMVKADDAEGQRRQVAEDHAAEVALVQSSVESALPPQAEISSKGPVVLALFSADSLNIPDVPIFSIKDKGVLKVVDAQSTHST